jgi:hypothetical protein
MDTSTKLFLNDLLGVLIITLTGMAFIIKGSNYIGPILIFIAYGFNRYTAIHHLGSFKKEIEALKKKVKNEIS